MLKVENLKVNYGHSEALRGVSLEVNEGEAVSLIGANGAGKSTLLKAISGLVKAAEGSISFDGQELTKLSPSQIVDLGVIQVPEGKHIFPEMTVRENLEMGASARKDGKAAIEEDIEFCFNLFPRLKERETQKGGTMSGGEQQMLAVARGIMAKPKILMLDEPSLGVAPIVVKEIMATLDNFAKRGMTVLLIEQNAKMAMKITQRTYVLDTGLITMTGKSEDLLVDPRIKKAYLGGKD